LLSLQIKESFMNANTPYNPFSAAAQAAIAELTSAQAQRFYALQGQKDIQNTLEATLTVVSWVYQLSELIYHLGALSRAWCDEMVADSEQLPVASSYVLCPAADPIALLPAAQPTMIRLPGALASSGVAIVTPAPKIAQEPVQIDAIERVSQPMGAETIALPQLASKPRQRRSTAKTKQPPATSSKSRRKSTAL
jgi:hypothetical protein